MPRINRQYRNTVMCTILVLEMVRLLNNLYVLLCIKMFSRKDNDLRYVLVRIALIKLKLYYTSVFD